VTSGHAWTAESDEELRDGVELGLSLDELAESLELPADVVAARLAGLGLEADGAAKLSFD
jgi:ATP-dependent DNA helicase DinG